MSGEKMLNSIAVGEGNSGDVAGRDINNFLVSSRLLLDSEKDDIRQKVRLIGEPWHPTWSFLKRTIKTDGLHTMRLEHYDPALRVLDLLLEKVLLERKLKEKDQAFLGLKAKHGRSVDLMVDVLVGLDEDDFAHLLRVAENTLKAKHWGSRIVGGITTL